MHNEIAAWACDDVRNERDPGITLLRPLQDERLSLDAVPKSKPAVASMSSRNGGRRWRLVTDRAILQRNARARGRRYSHGLSRLERS